MMELSGDLQLYRLYARTKACPQKLNVMQYIAYAQRGDFEKMAKESLDCVSCGNLFLRCLAGISHPMVGLA